MDERQAKSANSLTTVTHFEALTQPATTEFADSYKKQGARVLRLMHIGSVGVGVWCV